MGFHQITVYCDRAGCHAYYQGERLDAPQESPPLLAEQVANLLPLDGYSYGAAIVIVKLTDGWKFDSDGRVLCPNHEIQDRSPAHVTPT